MQLKTLMPDIYTLIPSDYASIRCREYERLLSLYMSRAVPSAHPRFVQVGGIPGAGKHILRRPPLERPLVYQF